MIQLKKPLIMYSIGFGIGLFLPQNHFQNIMNFYYNQINKNLTIIEFEDYYSLI